MTTEATNQLPALHPGTPPGMSVSVRLCVRHETERAYLLQISTSEATRTAWVPKSRVTRHTSGIGSVYRPDEPEGQRCRFDVFSFSMPAWLYEKLCEQLTEGSAK